MANWGEAVRIWAAFGVGARLAGGCPPRSGDCHRLPPSAKALPLSAKGLPLSAKTCHHLPRPASFWSGPWRSRGPLRSSVFNRCVGIVLMGLMLWHGGSWRGTEMRSVASDLLLENEGQGYPRPVTVCHINPEAWRRKPFPREAGPLSSPIPSLALRAGVHGFMVTRGVFNMSPMRERGDLGRGDLSVECFGGGRPRPLEDVPHDCRPHDQSNAKIAAFPRTGRLWPPGIVARPCRALWFLLQPVPEAFTWAARGRTFGARQSEDGARRSEEIPIVTDASGLPASIAVGHDLQSRTL